MIVDAQGRRFRNLRVSLTAACNYACTYCVPDGKRLQAATHELEADELTYAVKLLMDAAGIDRLRITGGEPMLTPKFDTFLPAVMALGLEDVSVTTNGQFVLRKFDTLVDSMGLTAATEAALAGGATLSSGGRRINFVGGGSRLTTPRGIAGGRGSSRYVAGQTTYI